MTGSVDKLAREGLNAWIAQRAADEVQRVATLGFPPLWTVGALRRGPSWEASKRCYLTSVEIVRTSTQKGLALALFQRMQESGTAAAYVLQAFDPREPTGWRTVALYENSTPSVPSRTTTGENVTWES